MKKYLILLFGAALFGCSDELTQSPSDQLPSNEAIKSVVDLNNAVNGAYVVMVDQGSYAGDFGLYADGKGGELIDLQSANHFAPVIRLQTDRNSTFSLGAYSDIYVGLARVNDILSVYDGVTANTTAEQTKKSELLGQLHALRALFHFDAARIFAQIPTAAANVNAANSGIIISKEKYPVSAKFKRSTLKESYDFIVTELLEAQKTLPKARAYGKFDYYSATALLSRVYLYMGEWANALKCAEEVIDGPYKLYTISNYTTVWSKTQTDESIFELVTTDLVSAQRNSIGYYTSPDGYGEAAMTDEFVQFMTPRTTDVRSKMIKKYGNQDGDYVAFWPMKYQGQEGATAPLYVNNPKLIRLSEMYLIAAEAIIKGATSSKGNSAAYYINTLRKNRISSYVDVATVTMDDVLTERRLEFFAENQRSFDLVRNKINIPNNPYNLGEITYSDKRLMTAIPQRETDINPGLTEYPGDK